MIIDLHNHTTYSDGKLSVKELLKYSNNKKIDILSITDHDSVDAHIELLDLNIKTCFNGKIIIGAELNVGFNGVKIEFLVYDFDLLKVKKWIDINYNKKRKNDNLIIQFNQLKDLCNLKNIKIDKNLTYIPSNKYPKVYPLDKIFQGIKKYEKNKKFFNEQEWNDYKHFYENCNYNKDFILYFDFSNTIPSAKECSDFIRNCGGKVFIAHIFRYEFNNHLEILNKLVKEKIIDGIEVYYPSFSNEQIKFLEEYCLNNKLYMSCGSDFHGKVDIIWNKTNFKENNILSWLNKK